MKIGIMTFHWAPNYGAVLQTYSLVNYLKKEMNAQVKVIDYYPKNLEPSFYNALKARDPRRIAGNLRDLKKEKKIKAFRRELPLTQRYYTNQQLKSKKLEFDYILAGSDQIWNPSFLMYGEKKPTPSYYLDFADESVKRLSVSASFGCENLPDECIDIAEPLLKKFVGISVRENTGKDILSSMGIEHVSVTADPTSLISKEDLMALCTEKPVVKPVSVSKFILRKQTKENEALINSICEEFSKTTIKDIDCLSIGQWLSAIRDSEFVVTNSFHCVMMCLKLHTPFAIILENGKRAGMNDRFFTLMKEFDLTERIVNDSTDIKNLKKHIDFSCVDKKMEEYSKSLRAFLEKNIKQ